MYCFSTATRVTRILLNATLYLYCLSFLVIPLTYCWITAFWLGIHIYIMYIHGATAPNGPGLPHYLGFTIRLGRTPLDEWSARRRDLYLTTHNTHKKRTHPCLRRDSNPQSQQAKGRRPTHYTADFLYTVHNSSVVVKEFEWVILRWVG